MNFFTKLGLGKGKTQSKSTQSMAQERPAAPPVLPKIDVQEKLQHAIELHQNGQLEQAQLMYEGILAIQSDHGDALHFLGLIAIQSGDHQRAVDLIGRAIAINPKHFGYYVNYGNALKQLGQLDVAVASLDKAIAIKPDVAAPYAIRGNALLELNQLDAAIASFDKALAIEPNDNEVWFYRGNALKNLNQLDAAVVSFERAVAIKPDFAEAYVNRGLALQELKQFDAAVASFGDAIAIKPDFAEAFFNRGLALQQLTPQHDATLDEAISMFDKACQLLPEGPGQHLRHAGALAKAKRFKEAEAAARRALAADPIDSMGAQMFLAGLGAEPMPDRISDAMLQTLYTARALTWDSKENAHYQGAALVGNALVGMQRLDSIDILDAGCGTGLVGTLVRAHVRRLDGVDMSQPMLDRAQEKGVYDTLFCGDMIAFLKQGPEKYDAVLSAATLIHFGSLSLIFEAAAIALRKNGLFIFTVFPNEKDSTGFAVDHLDGMAQGGCYVHGRDYLVALAAETGFKVESMEMKIHEYESTGSPKMCLLVTLNRY